VQKRVVLCTQRIAVIRTCTPEASWQRLRMAT